MLEGQRAHPEFQILHLFLFLSTKSEKPHHLQLMGGLFWLHGHPAAKILNYCSCVWDGSFKAVHKLGATCIFENVLLLLLEISTHVLLLL